MGGAHPSAGARSLPTSLLGSRVVVISDFNCPYCFTLNEWLVDLNLGSRVHWVGVEHKPHLPMALDAENRPDDTVILHSEVRDVQNRAPEVGVNLPPVWVNSHYPLMLQAAVEADHPELASAVRTAIFRRFWRTNANIATPLDLATCLAEAGLQDLDDLFIDAQPLAELTAWWSVELDRIPCMLAPTGARHLGLQDRAAVEAFVLGALHEPPPGSSCR